MKRQDDPDQLKATISERKRRHQGYRDLQARQIAARTRQIQQETGFRPRRRRKQRSAA